MAGANCRTRVESETSVDSGFCAFSGAVSHFQSGHELSGQGELSDQGRARAQKRSSPFRPRTFLSATLDYFVADKSHTGPTTHDKCRLLLRMACGAPARARVARGGTQSRLSVRNLGCGRRFEGRRSLNRRKFSSAHFQLQFGIFSPAAT